MPLPKDTEEILVPLLVAFDVAITAVIARQLAEIYLSGQVEMIAWAEITVGVFDTPPISAAVDWAEKHAATRVTQMAEETKRRLAKVISDGIKNKRGIPGLARDIRGTFDDMTKHRSELIARTETANALSQASLDNMEAMGVEGKEWVTVGDARVSDECLANEAQGVIPTKDSFTSGPMAPPQHPACRCSLAPAILRR